MTTMTFASCPVLTTTYGPSALLSDDPTNHAMRWLRFAPLSGVEGVVIENGQAFVCEDEGAYIAVKTTTPQGYEMVSERYVWAYV